MTLRIRALDRIRNPGLAGRWARLGSPVALGLTVGILFLGLTLAGAGAAQMPRTKAPADAKVYFITPKDGATVKSPVVVRFGLSGMGVAPAGIDKPNTGHHHLIIDAPLPPMDQPIPNDANHRHFGGGQTQVSLDLPPGKHTLQLLLGDENHVPHDPPVMSEKITITVE